MGFWSVQHLDIDDSINAGKNWVDVSRPGQRRQGPAPIADRGHAPGPARRRWVPDLVGGRWREAGGLFVVGSAYSPFVDGGTAKRSMSFGTYRLSRSVAEFQRAFLGDVVTGDHRYYGPVARLIQGAVGDAERYVLTDLVRACFMRTSDGKGGDDAVRADRDLFMAYARAGWRWTWARLVESDITAIVALGAEAGRGLLELLQGNGLRLSPSAAGWTEVTGVVGGRSRAWRVLRVYHPSRLNTWDPGYPAISAVRAMISGAPMTPVGTGPPAASRPATPPPTPRPAAAAPGGLGYWAIKLRGGPTTGVGTMLARDPDAALLTRRLLTGLTVQRLVAIADAMHNRCRVGDMQALAPGDPMQQSRLAWRALLDAADKVYRGVTGWATGAIELLAPGHEVLLRGSVAAGHRLDREGRGLDRVRTLRRRYGAPAAQVGSREASSLGGVVTRMALRCTPSPRAHFTPRYRCLLPSRRSRRCRRAGLDPKQPPAAPSRLWRGCGRRWAVLRGTAPPSRRRR